MPIRRTTATDAFLITGRRPVLIRSQSGCLMRLPPLSSIEITSALGDLSKAAQGASITKTAPEVSTATVAQTSATLKPDIVKLSLAGQAKLLHQQGKSPGLIASSLGIKVADVDGYLGIKVAPPVAATPAPSEASTKSASTSEHVAETNTKAPEATVPSSPAPQPVAIKPPTPKS